LTGLQPLLGLPEAIQALTFSPDGQRLAASDSNETPDDTVSLAVGDHDVDA
jgi:hypothetical protein